MNKFVFYTVLCERMGILSKEEATRILNHNHVYLKDTHRKSKN
ncbi:hypothetical protein ACQKP0_18215 [Heyndrickxia sp. NPDC080065]